MTAKADARVSADGRWITVDGRRWRATDPSIPDPFRKELVAELMVARRAVGAARRKGSKRAERAAHRQVDDAKVALGERGEPWWDESTDEGLERRLAATIRALSNHRAPDRTICPSDAARAIGGERWRRLMGPAREVVADLAVAGEVELSQRGQRIDPAQGWKGPIRIRRI